MGAFKASCGHLLFSSHTAIRVALLKYTPDLVVPVSVLQRSHHTEQNRNPFLRIGVTHGLAPDYLTSVLTIPSLSFPFLSEQWPLFPPSIFLPQGFITAPAPEHCFLLMFPGSLLHLFHSCLCFTVISSEEPFLISPR